MVHQRGFQREITTLPNVKSSKKKFHTFDAITKFLFFAVIKNLPLAKPKVICEKTYKKQLQKMLYQHS